MNRIRLLPLVAWAAGALLVLKAIGLATHGGYVLVGPSPANAASAQAQEADQAEAAGNDAPVAERGPAGPSLAPIRPVTTERPQEQPPRSQGADIAAPDAERQVLEQLSERRRQLDQQGAELTAREELVKAAEARLDERTRAIERRETEMKTQATTEEQQSVAQLASLVVIYESMKPKDAARIFDRLELDVLVPLARKMKPKKVADVVGAMTPEAAQRLTVALAQPAVAPKQGDGDLPKIEEIPTN